MGKSSGGVRSVTGKKSVLRAFGGNDFRVGKIENSEPLSSIANRGLYKDVTQGISKFNARIGGGTRTVRVAELKNAYGVYSYKGDSKGTVYLSAAFFKNGTKASVARDKREAYKAGWSTKTNKPTQHTVVHELAHSVWNSKQRKDYPNYKKAGNEIKTLYNSFMKERKRGNKNGFGDYVSKNVDEFFAEAVTKGVLGRSNKYTKGVLNIIKNNKLNRTP